MNLAFGLRVALIAQAALALGGLAQAQAPGAASDWPQWRGPNRDGVSLETGLARDWPKEGPPVAWEVDHLGAGYSSLAIQNGRIFSLGNLDGVEHVICLHAKDGSLAWATQGDLAAKRLARHVADALARLDADKNGAIDRAEAAEEKALAEFDLLDTSSDGTLAVGELRGAYGGFRDDMGAGPRSAPAIDGGLLYSLGCLGDLACLDVATGQTRWATNLIDEHGGRHTGRGYTESPLVAGDLLIVSPGGTGGAVAAFDKIGGQLVWRSNEVAEPIQYASAVFAHIAGEPTIVQFSSQGLFGVRARDGRLLWRYDRVSSGVANVCTPIVWQDRVFAASGYGKGGGLVKIVRDGDGWRAEEVYFNPQLANHHGGVVRVGDFLFGTASASLVAIDFFTGELAWNNRSVGKGALISADGMLYLVGEGREVALAEAVSHAYREHGRFELPDLGRPAWTHPAISGGRLYIRNQQRLTAFDVRAARAN